MTLPYEFGDGQPIVKVCLNREGWDWFVELVRGEFGPSDTFLKDVEAANDHVTGGDDFDDD